MPLPTIAPPPLRFLPLLASLILLVTLAGEAFAQGEYTVVYPARITWGEYVGDIDIARTSVGQLGDIYQPADSPQIVSAYPSREFQPSAISDGAGGFFLAYTIERRDSAGRIDRDVLLRHVDAAGNNLLGTEEVPMLPVVQSQQIEQNPLVATLADGSLFIAFEVYYGGGESGDVDIAAVRLARDGTPIGEGFWVARSKRQERLTGLLDNGRGGAYVLLESMTWRDSTLVNSDILLQQIDVTGTVGWKDSRDPVPVAASPHLERHGVAVADDSGGVFVAYELEYVGDGRNGDVDILAQHVSPFGRRTWTSRETPPIVSSYAGAFERRPVIAREGEGIVVAFEFSSPHDRKPVEAIGMQRLDSSGRAVWNGGRRSSLISIIGVDPTHPVLTSAPGGGVTLAFEGLDTLLRQTDVFAQRFDATGEELWGDGNGPVPVFTSPDHERRIAALDDGAGGLLVIAVREPVLGGNGQYSAIVANRIGPEGLSLWSDRVLPVVLVTSANEKLQPLLFRAR